LLHVSLGYISYKKLRKAIKNILTYTELITESKTSNAIEALVSDYLEAVGAQQELGVINGIKVVAVDRDKISEQHPEWSKYLGSHHWGKSTSYIPEDTIWVAQGLSKDGFIRVVNHELIEREAMRALEDNEGMTPEQAWDIAHPWVKSIGF